MCKSIFKPRGGCGTLLAWVVIIASMAPAPTAEAAVVQWVADIDGYWHDPFNWDSNPSLPATTDDVTIDRLTVTVAVTHSQDVDPINGDRIRSLICNETLDVSATPTSLASSLTVTGSSQINGVFTIGMGGTFNWAYGAMTGPAATTISAAGPDARLAGRLNIGNSASQNILLARTITNGGTVALSGTRSLYSHAGGSAPTISNQTGATFDVQSDVGLSSDDSTLATFTNAGTFKKSAGTGTSTVASFWTFDNTGAVQVQSGTLSLAGGGTSSGTFDVAPGAALNFSGGTHNLNATTFTNAGTINFSGGTASFGGAVSLPGTVNISNAVTVTGAGTLTASPGSTIHWTIGNMTGSGTTVISAADAVSPEARLNATFSGSPTQHLTLARTLTNAGSVVVNGSKGIFARGGGSAPTINNQAGATFDLQSNVGLDTYDGTSGSFTNAGTFKKSVGTGTSTIDSSWSFNNSGAVQVQSGTLTFDGTFTNSGTTQVQTGATLNLRGGGTSTAPPSGVAYDVASAATLNFNGGMHNLNGTTFGNAGTINFASTASFDGTVSLPGTVNISSTLTGSGTASLAGTASWTSGMMTDTGTTGKTEVAPGATLNVGNPSSLYISLARTINNAGMVVLSGSRGIYARGGGSPPTINNQLTGTFDLQSNVGLTTYDDTEGSFSNAGTFKKSAGTGTSTVDNAWTFNNPGTVQVQSGTLALNTVTQLPSTTLTGGTWIIGPGSTLNIITGGNILTNQGHVTLDGLGSTFNKINTLADNRGSFSILNGRNFTTGNLSNSGILEAGLGSTLTVGGSLATPTTGQLKIDGTANVLGTLSVGLPGPGGLLKKTGTGALFIRGPQQYAAGAVLQFGDGSGPSPEGSLSQAAASTVPEPGTLALLLFAGLCLLISARRWQR